MPNEKELCPYCGRDFYVGKMLSNIYDHQTGKSHILETKLTNRTNALGDDAIDAEIEEKVDKIIEDSPTYNQVQFAQINDRLDKLEDTFLSALERTRKFFSSDENKTSPSDRWRVTVGAATACTDAVAMVDSLCTELNEIMKTHPYYTQYVSGHHGSTEIYNLILIKGRLNAIRKRLLDRP
jgi:hypothetical protein